MRCNHCDNAPCVEICPTRALYRRSDGIVDFDNSRCIGCKSCMQACPYDALYIDPNSNTAAKCNFCAHRVEIGLQPACVIVCPTQAIIAGDLDDGQSGISAIVANEKVSVRKPQKGTEPKLFYVGIEGDLLQPTRLTRQSTYAWADQRDTRSIESGFNSGLTREVYDVAHPAPWGWKIAAYLWTKSIAAGVLLIAACLLAISAGPLPLLNIASPCIALAGLVATSLLLIFDLKRPDRFYYLLTKPNFRSWLVIGGYFLMLYGALAAAWLLSGLFLNRIPMLLAWCSAAGAIAASCYSAFLFAQARGRDLWQSPLFFWHLLVHAVIAGSSVLLVAGFLGYLPNSSLRVDAEILLAALCASFVMIVTEIALPHVTQDMALAMNSLVKGRFSAWFWGCAVVLGLVAPIALTAASFSGAASTVLLVASVLALVGVLCFEYLWVKAGQVVPLS
jgi:formate-dependent nitrite reductase membrane component NrfD/ferredoxin